MGSNILVNLQESKYESLSEALYAIECLRTGDPLFRDTKAIKFLFETQNLSEIIAHNQNCLKNECLILVKRFIKKYNLECRSKI